MAAALDEPAAGDGMGDEPDEGVGLGEYELLDETADDPADRGRNDGDSATRVEDISLFVGRSSSNDGLRRGRPATSTV